MTAAPFRFRPRSAAAALAGLVAVAGIAAPGGTASGNDTSNSNRVAAQSSPGGGPRTQGFDPVIAIVNGIGVRQSEVIETARNLPGEYGDLPLEMVWSTLVDRMVDIKLIAAEGRRSDLADDTEVRRRVFEATEQIIQEIYLTRFVEDRITERGLRRRYEDFLAKNPNREEISLRQIRLGTRQRAEELLRDLKAGAPFERLAKEWSNDPDGQRGGLMEWTGRPRLQQVFGDGFAETVFQTTAGRLVSAPIATDLGWHVVRVEEKRKLPPPSFEEARPRLIADWSSEIIADLMQRLRANADIQRFDVAAPDGTVGGDEIDTGTGLPSPGDRTPLPLPPLPEDSGSSGQTGSQTGGRASVRATAPASPPPTPATKPSAGQRTSAIGGVTIQPKTPAPTPVAPAASAATGTAPARAAATPVRPAIAPSRAPRPATATAAPPAQVPQAGPPSADMVLAPDASDPDAQPAGAGQSLTIQPLPGSGMTIFSDQAGEDDTPQN